MCGEVGRGGGRGHHLCKATQEICIRYYYLGTSERRYKLVSRYKQRTGEGLSQEGPTSSSSVTFWPNYLLPTGFSLHWRKLLPILNLRQRLKLINKCSGPRVHESWISIVPRPHFACTGSLGCPYNCTSHAGQLLCNVDWM